MNPQAVSAQKTRKIPKWLKIIGIIVAALIVFFVVVFIIADQATKNAVKVSNQFVADVQANNDSAAYNLASPAYKQSATEAQSTQILSSVSPALQGTVRVTGKAINKVSGQPDQATILYLVNTSAGTKYIRVILQDNHPWQVLDFRSSDTPLSLSSTN